MTEVKYIYGLPLVNGAKPVVCETAHRRPEHAAVVITAGTKTVAVCSACASDLLTQLTLYVGKEQSV